jgi:hypothetical protein
MLLAAMACGAAVVSEASLLPQPEEELQPAAARIIPSLLSIPASTCAHFLFSHNINSIKQPAMLNRRGEEACLC